jgi:hypothetical protein
VPKQTDIAELIAESNQAPQSGLPQIEGTRGMRYMTSLETEMMRDIAESPAWIQPRQRMEQTFYLHKHPSLHCGFSWMSGPRAEQPPATKSLRFPMVIVLSSSHSGDLQIKGAEQHVGSVRPESQPKESEKNYQSLQSAVGRIRHWNLGRPSLRSPFQQYKSAK